MIGQHAHRAIPTVSNRGGGGGGGGGGCGGCGGGGSSGTINFITRALHVHIGWHIIVATAVPAAAAAAAKRWRR